MDDVTIGGDAERAAREEIRIRTAATAIGLELNVNKCKAVSDDISFCNEISSILPGCVHVRVTDSCLLGGAIGRSALTSALRKQIESLSEIEPQLAAIRHHDALTLIRMSLGHPRAIYELRMSGAYRDPESLTSYDEALRRATQRAVNTQLPDAAWVQTCFPLSAGGIGIRRAGDLALAAFLSSVASSDELATRLSGTQVDGERDAA